MSALPRGPTRAVLRALALARLSPLSAWHYLSADRDVVVDVSKAERELGWSPRSSNGEALAAAYDWYLENRSGLGRAGPAHRRLWGEGALGLVKLLSSARNDRVSSTSVSRMIVVHPAPAHPCGSEG